jgi:hypothetical protein
VGEIAEADSEISGHVERALQIRGPFSNSEKELIYFSMNTPRLSGNEIWVLFRARSMGQGRRGGAGRAQMAAALARRNGR